jgi:hypothetical protein
LAAPVKVAVISVDQLRAICRVLSITVPPDDLLTAKQCAYLLGITERTLWNRRALDREPVPVRRGGRCYYPLASVAIAFNEAR